MTSRLKTFGMGQRVLVIYVEDKPDITLNALGTVVRVRSDGGAWVELDKRSKLGSAVHPFDASDNRGKNVLTYPELCEPAQGTKKTVGSGNRGARRASARKNKKFEAEPEVVTAQMFGKDHWSTFGYLTTIQIDGEPNRDKMRCDTSRHPFLAGRYARDTGRGGGGDYPTRLKGGKLLHNHDDWDCVDDLERVGLVENVGSRVNPMIRLTSLGSDVARQLADHKQAGGNFAEFSPKFESDEARCNWLPGEVADG